MIGEPVRLARQKRFRFVLRAGVFAVGVVAGAGVVGASVGYAGSTLIDHRPASAVVVVFLIAAAIARDLFGLAVPLPYRSWQVPRSWTQHFWLGSLSFGAAMGVGFLTFTSAYAYYLYIAACAFSGSVSAGAAIGGLFGLCYAAASFWFTALWWRLPAPMKPERARAVARVASRLGALASPLLLAVPGVWAGAADLIRI